MPIFRVSCPQCGLVSVEGSEIDLRFCGNVPLPPYYTFICPVCLDLVRKDVDAGIAAVFIGNGVDAHIWNVPAEALELHQGPRLTYNDLLDFILDIELD